MPEFGYELDLSIASAALVPLIKEWLDAAVRDMVLQVGGRGGCFHGTQPVVGCAAGPLTCEGACPAPGGW